MLRTYLIVVAFLLPIFLFAQTHEICGDGIDNDNDGAIDEVCQPFECDGRLFQSAKQGNNFLLYQVDVNPIYFAPLVNLTAQGVTGSFNSLAYNPVDNLMYGMGTSDSKLYRIDASGQVKFVGNVTGFSTFKNAGTFDNLGNYYLFGDNTLYKVDLSTLTYTTIGNPGQYGSADIVFNPTDNLIYGWSGGPKLLFTIDPNTGTQSPVPANAPLSNNSWGWIGALYFNAQGDILGYQGTRMIKIDPTTGIGVLAGTGTNKSSNDGCSCSFGVEMTKSVTGSFAAGDTITYTFDFYNQSFSPITTSLLFEDILTDGVLWASDPYNVNNLQLSGNTNTQGTATAQFTLTSLPKGQASFSIDAVIPCDYSQTTYTNQANLSNLPPPLNDKIFSDNPNTAAINDPTTFTLTTAPLLVNKTVENIICERAVGSIDIAVTGGTTPFSYQWNTGQTNATITGLGTGTYTLSITDGTGCTSTFSADVLREEITLNTTYTPQKVQCKGNADGSLSIESTIGGYPPYSYSLDNNNYELSTNFMDLEAGNYTLYTKDSFGCRGQNSFIIIEPTFVLDLIAPNDTSLLIGDLMDGTITPNTITPVIYEWTPTNGLSCSDCPNPIVQATETTTYTIKGTDTQGCIDSTEFTITVDDNPRVFIPNAFSPNNDRNNDRLTIYSPGDVAVVKSFKVFDRWGECVFVQQNFPPNNEYYGWDGSFNGKPLNSSVFIFYAEVLMVDGRTEIITGDVTLFL